MTSEPAEFAPEYLAAFESRLEAALRRLGADKPACISQSTHNAYLRACRGGIRLKPGEWGHEASPKTRWYRRAAYRYWARVQLSDRHDLFCGRRPRFGTVAMESFCGDLYLLLDTEEHLDAIEEHLDRFEMENADFPPKPPSLAASTMGMVWPA